MPGSENLSKEVFYYIYALASVKRGGLYIGFTKDLKKQLQEHNRKENISTAPFSPYELIYYEACRNELDARRREKYLKMSQGSRMLKRRLKEYFYSKKSS
ncbi:MAG: GIY-YIG nuclease family protein [Candidatus Moraniibacteriota bacterium]